MRSSEDNVALLPLGRASKESWRDEDDNSVESFPAYHEEDEDGPGQLSITPSPSGGGTKPRTKIWISIAVVAILAGSAFLFAALSSNPLASKRRLLSFFLGPGHEGKTSINHTLYYEWHTKSSFDPVRINSPVDLSTQDLCSAFPKHLFKDIAVVLKTGHGVLESRVQPQLHTALSCLDGLLVFSDITETFEGRELIDVIGDTPSHLLNATEQLEPYRRLRKCIENDESADCGDTITPKEGWKIDKFKFLPSVLRAWRMQPEKEWYVFIEADTYVVWDTVLRLLTNFDPDEAWYFGSPSPGKEGTWFAYGGTGLIISREAMRILTAGEQSDTASKRATESLVEVEWKELLTDCCGDSILGWSLYKRGVELSGLWPLFNPHPPTSIPFSERYWCQPVLSMHKPNIEDLEGLWRWEWQERQKEPPLLYRDMALSYLNITTLDRKQGWDNAAWDELGFDGPPGGETVDVVEANTADECAEACDKDAECYSWTHHGYTCSLVHSIRVGKARYLEPDSEDEEPVEDRSFVAGWAGQRIQGFVDAHACENVLWVRPSTERIF